MNHIFCNVESTKKNPMNCDHCKATPGIETRANKRGKLVTVDAYVTYHGEKYHTCPFNDQQIRKES